MLHLALLDTLFEKPAQAVSSVVAGVVQEQLKSEKCPNWPPNCCTKSFLFYTSTYFEY